MNSLVQDVRFALRRLRKNRGFAAVAILTLALGIGASAVIFSVVYNGVLHPFPYRAAEHLTAINMEDLQEHRDSRGMYRLDEVAAFRQGNHSFEDILAYGLYPSMVYSLPSGPEMVKAVGATTNAMEFWGVAPLLGRGFGERDVQSGAPPVVLLNYLYWRREFNGDKSVVGTTMMLNGKARTVIGVMPPRFQAVGADMYMPVSWTRPEPVHSQFEWDVDDPLYFWATGILKPGVTFETAEADIDVMAREMAKIHPDDYPKKFRVTMKLLNDTVLGNLKQTLLLLFAAVGLLLFICCSNVAGLLLAHASARTKEIALRAALGATRRRLIRQLLSESMVLALAGCGLGCLLAYAGLKGLMLTQITRLLLPMETLLSMNRPVLFFAAGVSLLSALLCGLAPALHASRRDLQASLAGTGVNVNAGFQHSRFRSGLVIGQVALSILLLTCAGLVARSFTALVSADLGVRPEQVFNAQVHFPRNKYMKAEDKRAFFSEVLPKLESIPGVKSATALVGMPLLFAPRGDVTIPGKPHTAEWTTRIELCSEDYFNTLGLHLLRGRLLNASDILSARKVVVVNEKLARKYFGDEDALGRTIKFNILDEVPETPHDAYFEIVGIISDARNYDMEGDQAVLLSPEKAMPQGFLPYSISGYGDRGIAMKTSVRPALLVNDVRRVLWNYDHDIVLAAPALAMNSGFSLDDLMETLVYGKPKFMAIAFSACAGLGFVLAIVGLFSLMTYIVSLKTHDIGVRLALGAPPATILSMMLSRGFVLTGIGILIGLGVSVGATHFLSALFHGVSAHDPLTYAVVIVLVMLAGLSACLLPARRAAQVDPMVTLRNE